MGGQACLGPRASRDRGPHLSRDCSTGPCPPGPPRRRGLSPESRARGHLELLTASRGTLPTQARSLGLWLLPPRPSDPIGLAPHLQPELCTLPAIGSWSGVFLRGLRAVGTQTSSPTAPGVCTAGVPRPVGQSAWWLRVDTCPLSWPSSPLLGSGSGRAPDPPGTGARSCSARGPLIP